MIKKEYIKPEVEVVMVAATAIMQQSMELIDSKDEKDLVDDND